jgi:hypothetical protein
MLAAYRRPVALLAGLVLVPLAAVLFLTHRVNLALGRAQALHNLRVTAQLAAQAIQETFDDSVLYEQMLLAQPGFAEAVRGRDLSHVRRALERAFPLAPEADLVTLVSPEGRVLAAHPDQPRLIGRDVSAEDAFAGAQAARGAAYVSAVYLHEASWAQKVAAVTVPVVHEAATVGWLQVQHRVEAIRRWLQRIRVEPEGFVYVVDHRGQLVVYPFQVLPGRPKVVADWPTVAARLGSGGATLRFAEPRTGERWLAGLAPVGATGWRVVAVQPEAAVFRLVHRVMLPMALAIGFLLLLVMAVGLRWVQLQAFSLRLLKQNAKLLKQAQQRRTLERGKPPGGGA